MTSDRMIPKLKTVFSPLFLYNTHLHKVSSISESEIRFERVDPFGWMLFQLNFLLTG